MTAAPRPTVAPALHALRAPRGIATFASPFLDETLHVGPIAMVGQSGAMAGMLYEMAEGAH